MSPFKESQESCSNTPRSAKLKGSDRTGSELQQLRSRAMAAEAELEQSRQQLDSLQQQLLGAPDYVSYNPYYMGSRAILIERGHGVLYERLYHGPYFVLWAH